MFLLGIDIGSSSVKVALVNSETGLCEASAFYPKQEAPIISHKPGWAEQDPEQWWSYFKEALAEALAVSGINKNDITAIGISYQMHGLVLVDKKQRVLRPSIIWCDSRAVPYGQKAFTQIGGERCLAHLLNSPGNFTAAKLAWVKENEPDLYARVDKIMLPGDYIAMRLTGEICSTVSGLSEGIFWDFKNNCISEDVLHAFGFGKEKLPTIQPTFGDQGSVSAQAARELGLSEGTLVSYRAGDQPNNALSLNVFNPGEVAATAGTSGVVYGISDKIKFDTRSRINSFVHVNHTASTTRIGVMLCINGTGILNSWMRKNVLPEMSYEAINELAATAPIGAGGISILPFGNGVERVLENKEIGCHINGVNFNVHGRAHLARAAQEGIVFTFRYGMDIMQQVGITTNVIRAGKANMFLSPVFRQTLANVTGAVIELYDTDGAVGAAKGAGMGAGIYKNEKEAFTSLKRLAIVEPNIKEVKPTCEAYDLWLSGLNKLL
jgi:xylulokinase